MCTGSLILGAAGLLEGRRAACHWAVREQLAHLGAIADAGRGESAFDPAAEEAIVRRAGAALRASRA